MEIQAKKRILLVEDDTFLADMYITKLTDEGFEVVLCTDGQQAIDKYKEDSSFDLILLDLMLPKIAGSEVLKQIRMMPGGSGAKVMILTNLDTDEEKQKINQLGAVGYLLKSSLTPLHLVEKIKEALS